eukprot:776210-Prymnesium_polylepis.4
MADRAWQTANVQLSNVVADGAGNVSLARRAAFNRSAARWAWAGGSRSASGLYYSGGAFVPPPDVLVREDKQQVLPWVRWSAFGFAVLNFLLAAAAIWFVVTRRHSTVVQASQPAFLVLVALGVVTASASIFFLGVDDSYCGDGACVDSAVDPAFWNQTAAAARMPSCAGDECEDRQACDCAQADAACMGVAWTYSFGFALSHSTLAMKLWRMGRIFALSSDGYIAHIPASTQYVKIGAIISVQLAILLVWQAVNPLTFWRTTKERDEASHLPTESIGRCRATDPAGAPPWIFVGALIGVNIGLLLLGLSVAFHARRITAKFIEAKWVGLCFGVTLEAIVMGLPLMVFTARESPTSFFVSATGIAFFSGFSILATIFAPKIVSHLLMGRDERRKHA